MIKHKKLLLCLVMLLISIILLLTLSIKTGNISNKVNDLEKQVGIEK